MVLHEDGDMLHELMGKALPGFFFFFFFKPQFTVVNETIIDTDITEAIDVAAIDVAGAISSCQIV